MVRMLASVLLVAATIACSGQGAAHVRDARGTHGDQVNRKPGVESVITRVTQRHVAGLRVQDDAALRGIVLDALLNMPVTGRGLPGDAVRRAARNRDADAAGFDRCG